MCIAVESISLIFAVFNVMFWSACSLLSAQLLGFVYYKSLICGDDLNWGYGFDLINKLIVRLTNMVARWLLPVLTSLTIAFCTELFLAVVLIKGIIQRNAYLVKCYFVNGVLAVIVGGSLHLWLYIETDESPVILILILIDTLFALVLVFIYKTYKKFEADVQLILRSYSSVIDN